MSQFKEDIKRYQVSGDRTIIDKIMASSEKDFMRTGHRYRVKDGTRSGGIRISLPDDFEYISYRIRAMRTLLMRHVRIEFADIPYINEFQRYLSIIHIDFGIKLKAKVLDSSEWILYFEITPALFAELESHLSELEERFTVDEFRHFMRMFNEFKAIEQEMREKKEAREREINETTITALEYALKYVDITKSEKEIVKYVNKAFRSKLSDAEAKQNGMRRIQRKGFDDKRMSHLVKPYFPDSVDRVIFGFEPKDIGSLNDGQREFIARVRSVVNSDRLNDDTTNYTCDTTGEVRVSKKYIAQKLGMREDLVRKKLERIKKKLV